MSRILGVLLILLSIAILLGILFAKGNPIFWIVIDVIAIILCLVSGFVLLQSRHSK